MEIEEHMATPTTTSVPPVAAGASLRLPMSWEDYQALGETPHTEYAGGLLIVNPPILRHALVIAGLIDLLRPACPPSHVVLTGAGWRTGRERDRIPDIMVIDRFYEGDAILLRPPPLVVIEVMSPSTRDIDLRDKREEYGTAGAGWYWLVDPDGLSVTVFEQRDQEMVLAQEINAPAVVDGPLPVQIDPAALAG